jgi:hypothetical protein
VTQEKGPDSGKSWLQDKLARLDAIYQRFGRDGLREHPLPEVSLLLQSKELAFRDLPKRELMEGEKKAARELELEIRDLTAYVNGQLALVGSPGLRIVRGFGGQAHQNQQPSQQRGYRKRHIEHER